MFGATSFATNYNRRQLAVYYPRLHGRTYIHDAYDDDLLRSLLIIRIGLYIRPRRTFISLFSSKQIIFSKKQDGAPKW